MQFQFLLLAAASLASGAVIRRGEPTMQETPTKAKADNTFSNGKPMLASLPPTVAATPSEIYGVRDIDLPFGRLYNGDMKFFSKGQLNSPDGITDQWMGQPGVVDSANQSACGIPDNAFSISKVAIHPYFLKYADLSRYCMQDVCISFWNGKQKDQGQSDMMLKVTDVCSTDPNDPTHCAKPGDIKIDRTKTRIMEQIKEPGNVEDIEQVNGNQFFDGISVATSKTWWFFTKCWADGLVQPAYTDNWFAQPPIPNNLEWSQKTQLAQYVQNKKTYKAQTPPWPEYLNMAYNATYVDIPITDWSPTEKDPEWCPIAGGKGWGIPTGNCPSGSNQGSSNTPSGTGLTTPGSSSAGPSNNQTSSTGPSGTGSSGTQSSSAGSLESSSSSTAATSSTSQGASSQSTSTSTPAAAASSNPPYHNGTYIPAHGGQAIPIKNATGGSLTTLQGDSAIKSGAQVEDDDDGEDDTCEW